MFKFASTKHQVLCFIALATVLCTGVNVVKTHACIGCKKQFDQVQADLILEHKCPGCKKVFTFERFAFKYVSNKLGKRAIAKKCWDKWQCSNTPCKKTFSSKQKVRIENRKCTNCGELARRTLEKLTHRCSRAVIYCTDDENHYVAPSAKIGDRCTFGVGSSGMSQTCNGRIKQKSRDCNQYYTKKAGIAIMTHKCPKCGEGELTKSQWGAHWADRLKNPQYKCNNEKCTNSKGERTRFHSRTAKAIGKGKCTNCKRGQVQPINGRRRLPAKAAAKAIGKKANATKRFLCNKDWVCSNPHCREKYRGFTHAGNKYCYNKGVFRAKRNLTNFSKTTGMWKGKRECGWEIVQRKRGENDQKLPEPEEIKGVRVRIKDLKKKPELNGSTGVIVREISGVKIASWKVRLDNGETKNFHPMNFEALPSFRRLLAAAKRSGAIRVSEHLLRRHE